MKTVPYTYLIGWIKPGAFYYGVRFRRGCDPSDLWRTYFTSSAHVAAFRKLHGEPDVIQVRRKFSTPADAFRWEQTVLRRTSAGRHAGFLNQVTRRADGWPRGESIWKHPSLCTRMIEDGGQWWCEVEAKDLRFIVPRAGVWYRVIDSK